MIRNLIRLPFSALKELSFWGSLHQLCQDLAPAREDKEVAFSGEESRLSVGDFISQVFLKPGHHQFMLAASWAIESLGEIPLSAVPYAHSLPCTMTPSRSSG